MQLLYSPTFCVRGQVRPACSPTRYTKLIFTERPADAKTIGDWVAFALLKETGWTVEVSVTVS